MDFPARPTILLAVALATGCHPSVPSPNAVTYARPRACPDLAPSKQPAYPLDDDGTPLRGSVRLRLHLTSGGSVRRAEVLASDDPRLERSACQAVLALRFEATGADQTTEYTQTFLDD